MSDSLRSRPVSDIAFTPAVKAMQERMGSRSAYARMEAKGGWSDRVTPELADFIAERDSVYLGTANAEGQPYIQHRGGAPGFLKVLDDRTLGFADYSGNRQYITAGTLSENGKAFLFLMDYPNRRRIKIWGRARAVENDPVLSERASEPDHDLPVERVILFEIDAWDVNCPKYITPRYTEAELATALAPLKERLAFLEAENAGLKDQIRSLVPEATLEGTAS